MRDDDRMMDLPDEFGSGVIGVCDICGERQAVVVLQKERFKLCVLDFLNKSWIKTDKKPGAPAPLYRSERVWYTTRTTPDGRAPAIILSPTKVVKHPVVLVTPDVYGITTTLLDAAIRFARDGYEVMIPDLAKTDRVGGGLTVALRSGAQFRGGVALRSKKVTVLMNLYADALDYLRAREMVDPTKAAVFGASYGATLALAIASQDTRLAGVVLAYPHPSKPADLAKLVTAPIFLVAGSSDRSARKAREQLEAVRGDLKTPLELFDVPGVRHDFLSRDMPAYDLPRAEEAWSRILAFLKRQLVPPPPKPPAPPVTKPPAPTAAPAAAPPKPAPPAASPKPAAPAPTSPSPPAPAPTSAPPSA